jgi:hypothetical protein
MKSMAGAVPAIASGRSTMCRIAAITLSSLLLAGSAWAAPGQPNGLPAGEGLQISADSQDAWSPWQARLSYTAPVLPLWGQPASSGLMLAGDRYFRWGRLGDAGGLRATGGVLLGSNSAPGHGAASDLFWRAAAPPQESDAMPYLGLGYSAWWAKSSLGLSADLGLAAQRPGQAVRFGRVVSGSDSLDGMLRAMQIAPMFQVNLSYAF